MTDSSTYTTSLVIAIVYTLLLFIETKYISKNEVTMKQLVKGAFFAYLASLSGIYIVNNIVSPDVSAGDNVKVFTGEPDF
uniref:Uncharacterized protein n=1 Tax=viral metagenome TaxID=1070528 RepID=A0A6C0BVF4_9ZZZZ